MQRSRAQPARCGEGALIKLTMTRTKFVLLFILVHCAVLAHAQTKLYYSYINDRRFTDITDLQGYLFHPGSFEIRGQTRQEFQAGSYSFVISGNNLYVAGDQIKGVYSVNSIKPAEYGYILTLMNARDPTLQGHLKVILTDRKYVDALVFKRSSKDKEMIFLLNDPPQNLSKREAAYFTDLREFVIENTDSLWGKSIKPFLLIERSSGQQQRLQMADSTELRFIETIEVIDKRKKPKNAQPEPPLTYPLPDSLVGHPDIRLERSYSAVMRTMTYYEDGRSERLQKVFEIEKASIREEKNSQDPFKRFVVSLKTKSGDLDIFLDTDKQVSYFNYGTRSYLMRGY
jgi:hypothetical protein